MPFVAEHCENTKSSTVSCNQDRTPNYGGRAKYTCFQRPMVACENKGRNLCSCCQFTEDNLWIYIYGSSAPNHPVCIVQSCVCEDTGQIVHSKTQRWSRISRGEADHHPNDTATTVLSALDPDPTAMLSERYMLLLILTGVGKWVAQHPETQHCADQHITVPSWIPSDKRRSGSTLPRLVPGRGQPSTP